jgi:hypothetical protein
MSHTILKPDGCRPLVLADNEHYSAELFEWISSESCFDLLVPMPLQFPGTPILRRFPSEALIRHWAGYATAKQPYSITRSYGGPQFQLIQRKGTHPQNYDFKAFLCTSNRDEMQDLSPIILNDGTLKSSSKMTRLLGGSVPAR